MLTKYIHINLSPTGNTGGAIALSADNWEYYAILYVDNELHGTDRKIFEDYTNAHPALIAELEQLKSVQLPTEEVVFQNKTLLLKPNTNIAANWSQLLVMYIDGELDSTTKSYVAQQLELNSNLYADYKLLLQTKLTAEPIPMPNKKALYKKEKRPAGIIPLWLRYTAAACLVAFITLTIALNYNTKNTTVTASTTNEAGTTANNDASIVATNEENNQNISSVASTTDPTQVMNNENQETHHAPSTIFTALTQVKKDLNNNPSVTNSSKIRSTYINTVDNDKNYNQATTISVHDGYEDAPELINTISDNEYKNIKHLAYQTTIIDEDAGEEQNVRQTTIMGVPIEKIDRKGKVKKLAGKIQKILDIRGRRNTSR